MPRPSPHDDASAPPRMSPIQTTPFPGSSPHHTPGLPPVSLPPLRHVSTTPPAERQGNGPGLRSILNPQAEIIEQQRNRRRSASQMESPSPIEAHSSQSLPSISRPPSVESSQEETLPSRSLGFRPPGRPPARHMLSPISPSLHRPQGVEGFGAPTGTIDAHQSPFLTASTQPYVPEPNAPRGAPTPPIGHRAAYFPPGMPTAPTPPPSMMRGDMRRSSGNFAQSGAASPVPSYSPYSQAASVASSQQSREYSNPPAPAEGERSMIPMQQSAQNSIQIMTFKSQGGHHVQIPVDVQAASKVADEKRKRNAGASARFRQRRKEKEQQASASISRLEQQLREAVEDAEYYRGERDYFKAVLTQQQPGADQHYARPPSPRLHRRHSTAPSSNTGGGGSVSSYSTYDEPENTRDAREPADRNVRRRTSSYHPAAGPPPSSAPASAAAQNNTNGSAPQSQHYPPAYSPQHHPQQQQPPHPSQQHPHQQHQHHQPTHTRHPQQYESHEQRPLPDLQLPPSQRPLLRDPFAADAARHPGGNWGPGQGR